MACAEQSACMTKKARINRYGPFLQEPIQRGASVSVKTETGDALCRVDLHGDAAAITIGAAFCMTRVTESAHLEAGNLAAPVEQDAYAADMGSPVG